MKRMIKCKQNGFTIMEMIVSISIIAVISAITLTNYHESNQVAKLNSETYKLASLIREVQDWSLGVKKDKNGNMPDAWGFDLKTSASDRVNIVTYLIDDTGELTGMSASPEKTILFADGVTISNLNTGQNSPITYLAFVPPDPKTKICRQNYNSSSCNKDFVEITLRDRFSAKTRKIKINKFGLVDIE